MIVNARKTLALTVAAAAGTATLLVAPTAQAEAGTDKATSAPVSASAASDGAAAQADQKVLGLADSTPRYRPMPVTPQLHTYRFDTSTRYWSVVATRSPTFGDVDLDVYDDKARAHLAGRSQVGGNGTVDFVAFDGNHRPLGDYYPQVKTYSGTGSYIVEFDSGSKMLSSTPLALPMANEDVVSIFDTYLYAGTTYTFELEPGTAAMDGDLYLLGSTAGNESSWVQNSTSAVRASALHGVGQAESFEFTPTATDYYGVVVLNRATGGTYELTRTS